MASNRQRNVARMYWEVTTRDFRGTLMNMIQGEYRWKSIEGDYKTIMKKSIRSDSRGILMRVNRRKIQRNVE